MAAISTTSFPTIRETSQDLDPTIRLSLPLSPDSQATATTISSLPVAAPSASSAAVTAAARNINSINLNALSPSTSTATPATPTTPTLPIKPSRPASFLALASAAFDRAEQKIRPRQSLNRLSIINLDLSALAAAVTSQDHSTPESSPSDRDPPAALERKPLPGAYSQPYSQTNPNLPPPILLPRSDSAMHQTSSRLLRMTDDDRPFTKDFKDLFSTLIVSLLPLSAHRVRLTKVEHTFLSEDAINNLGSLKFSQSNRMPDPKDPSRIVTTTTTTTFSMARDMARSICQRFLDRQGRQRPGNH